MLNKNAFYLCLYSLLLLNIGCKDKQTGSLPKGTLIEVTIGDATYSSLLSRMKDIEIIPLETNDSSILGIAHIVRVNKEYIAIVDQQSQEIHIYTETGRFVNKIAKAGQGPEEYIRIDDICLHPEKNHLLVLDGIQKKTIEYTIAGNFVASQKIPLPISPNRFVYTGDKRLFFDKGIPFDQEDFWYSVFSFSEALEPIAKLFPYDQASHFVLSPRQTLQPLEDKLFYLPVYSQTIFRINKTEPEPVYTYSFGKNDLNKDFLFDYSPENPFDLLNKLEESAHVYFFNVSLANNCILADFRYKGKPYFHIYRQDNKSQSVFYDEAMEKCNSTIIPLTCSGNKFISLIQPDQLELLHKSSEARDRVMLEENDNPAIIKYTF